MTVSSIAPSTHIQNTVDDPSLPQRRAADPRRHVWVRASAGSGKTTVLVRRVLRLMLPDPETGRPGTIPERILCITYTKAGATNMAIRIQDTLMQWSVCDEKKLHAELFELFGREDYHEAVVTAARQLFAFVLDRPDRLRMMTIHSFCQSILARFPLEAGLSPSMTVLDEGAAKELQNHALERAITHLDQNDKRIAAVLDQVDLQSLQKTIGTILSSPYIQDIFYHLRRDERGLMDLYLNHFAITAAELNGADEAFVNLSPKDIDIWAEISSLFKEANGKVSLAAAESIDRYIAMNAGERLAHINDMIDVMLKRPTSKILKENAHLQSLYEHFNDKISKYRLTKEIGHSLAITEIAYRVYKDYNAVKSHQNVVDYDDLIMRTKTLLSSDMAWVHYKLDGGIDHILLDESQDTTPAQWHIIQKLSEEMFTIPPEDQETRPRSLFVVGDEKQSIFSFQGADPDMFHDMLAFFRVKTTPYQDTFEESLRYSFRSTKPVLDLVDKVFEPPSLSASLLGAGQTDPVFHFSHRHTHRNDTSGSVELWLETDEYVEGAGKTDGISSWSSVFKAGDDAGANPASADYRLLIKIANRIEREIQDGNWRPEDVMILFRSRNHQMNNLIKMLKWRGLPVSGIDRLVLNKHIVIKDILALAEFIHLNQDDFALACFLKSPFIGWDEDKLYECAALRPAGRSLWDHITQTSAYDDVRIWINAAMDRAATMPVFEWLSSLLIDPCPADPHGSGYRACVARFGAEIMDPLDEMISDSLRVELQDVRTLPDFIQFFGGGAREIKRELSKESGEIRVMTVHASKGLEAPVVIVPDTISTPSHKKTSPVVWVHGSLAGKGAFHIPLITPFKDKDDRSALYTSLRDDALNAIKDEEKRLLYVALTRAEDSLIVCGAYKATKNQASPKDESWHHMVANGFDRLNIAANAAGDREWGQSYSVKTKPHKSKGDAASDTSLPPPPIYRYDDLPSWVTMNVDPLYGAAATARIINPSLATGRTELMAASPDDNDPVASFLSVPNGRNRYLRGNITHRLLQILPTVDDAQREDVARSYVARNRFDLSPALQDDIVMETMRILTHAEFRAVFAAGSEAEVPILGRLSSGEIVSGQIDRLYIGENEVLIVDYKTNRPSPDDVRNIPAAYRAQLGLYKELLQQIYPDKTIKTALLWTDKPLFMTL